MFENLTVTELCARVNSIEAVAKERGLEISFSLQEHLVSGSVFVNNGSSLDRIFYTEHLQGYNPVNRDADGMSRNIYETLTELVNFILSWKGREVEALTKEVKELEAKLEVRRKALAEAEMKANAE